MIRHIISISLWIRSNVKHQNGLCDHSRLAKLNSFQLVPSCLITHALSLVRYSVQRAVVVYAKLASLFQRIHWRARFDWLTRTSVIGEPVDFPPAIGCCHHRRFWWLRTIYAWLPRPCTHSEELKACNSHFQHQNRCRRVSFQSASFWCATCTSHQMNFCIWITHPSFRCR